MIECRYFEICDAPLCPLDKNSLKHGIWYPDEPICKLRSVPDWVRRQRKIAKKITDRDNFFTLEMLQHKTRITISLTGIDPNQSVQNAKRAIKTWFSKHREYNSKELKERGRKLAEKMKRVP